MRIRLIEAAETICDSSDCRVEAIYNAPNSRVVVFDQKKSKYTYISKLFTKYTLFKTKDQYLKNHALENEIALATGISHSLEKERVIANSQITGHGMVAA